MPGHDIIVVGTSAGGLETLCRLVGGLPPGFPAALFVVCHFPEDAHSRLPDILSRSGPLLATHAQDGEPVRPGHVYVARPGYHMVLTPGQVRLTRGPRENHFRPAIDPLFRSAARAYGRRVVGVVLSGSLTDGSAGLLAIRAAGGVAVVQDPADASVAGMPLSAGLIAGADYTLPVAAIPATLVRLAGQPVSDEGGPNMSDPIEGMPRRVERDMAQQEGNGRRGQLTMLTCPECGGSMWQVDDSSLTRFRCHVGHAYYAEALLAEQNAALEAALWTAVRTFKEKTVLARQLAARERQVGNEASARRFEEEGELAERYGRLIQENLLRAAPGPYGDPPSSPPPDVPPPGGEGGTP